MIPNRRKQALVFGFCLLLTMVSGIAVTHSQPPNQLKSKKQKPANNSKLKVIALFSSFRHGARNNREESVFSKRDKLVRNKPPGELSLQGKF
jgi:hypothetical protein